MKKTILSICLLACVAIGTFAFKNKTQEPMKVIIEVTNEVKDFETWKKGFDADKASRDKAGLKVMGVYTSVDNGKMVTVLAEVPSVEAAYYFISNPELQAAMEKAGVISKPEIKVLMKQD